MRGDATVLVGIKASEIVGVGIVDHYGEVLLNYVRPDARFSGVSKATRIFRECGCRNGQSRMRIGKHQHGQEILRKLRLQIDE